MSTELSALRDTYSEALNALFDARDAADAAGDSDLKAKVQAEIFDTLDAQASVQDAINATASGSMNAVADALEERVQSQQALGFTASAGILKAALDDIRPPEPIAAPPVPPKPVAASPGLPDGKKGIVRAVLDAAKAHALSPQMVLAIVAIESDFNPTATNPVSSAGGLFQFIDSTWKAAGGAEIGTGGKGNGFAAQASVEDQAAIGTQHLADIKQRLIDKGITTPTPTAIYMAHQQGFGGALKILTATPTAPIETAISEAAARNNRLDGLTVAQAKQRFHDVVQAHLDEVQDLLQPAETGTTIAAPLVGGERKVANKAPAVALNEMSVFARENGNVVTEDQDPLHARGLEYFRFVKRPRSTITGTANAWSAAFISFVLHKAGMDPVCFPFAPNHARYILQALQNSGKVANNTATDPEKALTYHEIGDFPPRVGDLIGYGSTLSVSPVTNDFVKTTADLRKHLPNKHFPSHTDLVIDVRPGRLKAIGGNVTNSIRTKTFNLDEEGRILPGQKPFFVLAINV